MNTPVSTMVLYPGIGYRYEMQRFFCRKGRYEYGVFNISGVDHFFLLNAWLEIWSTFCMGEKKREITYWKTSVFFLLHHQSWVQGWGRLFMIHCWYTMSMMFSNGWRGTESTLLRHLFSKTGGMNGREWFKVTGGFPRRTLVLIIWERAVALFFFLRKLFCTYDRLKRIIRPPRLISPLVLKGRDFESLLLLLTPLLSVLSWSFFLPTKYIARIKATRKLF